MLKQGNIVNPSLKPFLLMEVSFLNYIYSWFQSSINLYTFQWHHKRAKLMWTDFSKLSIQLQNLIPHNRIHSVGSQ